MIGSSRFFVLHCLFFIFHSSYPSLTMPRALAIETSGRIGSVAVARNGVTLAVEQFPHGLQHAAEIIPRIDSLCRNQGWSPADLEELYLSVGPGSFTGLRI